MKVKTLLIVFLAALVLIVNAQWLIPVGVVLGIAYLVYRGVRSATSNASAEYSRTEPPS